MTDIPENNPSANDVIDPDHSIPLDVHTWSEHPEINRLVDELWFFWSYLRPLSGE